MKISILLIKQDVNEMPEICKYKVTLDRNGDEVQKNCENHNNQRQRVYNLF